MKQLCAICTILIVSNFAMGQGNKKPLTKVQYFPPNQIQISSEDFLKNQLLDATFIHKLDPDRLLYYFRQTAKMANADDCPPYGGWEGTDLKGHTLGHYLTALSYNYAIYHRHGIKDKIDHIVAVLAECQDSIGTGYLSAFSESKLDEADLTGQGWAPYYTLHKILQGLLDAYSFANSAQAITVASWMGDYIDSRMKRINDMEQWQKNLEIMEVGGMAESLYNLYIITQKPEHLDAANRFNLIDSKIMPAYHHHDVLNDSHTDNFHHANATIPQFIGVLRAYNINHNDTLLLASENFWDEVVNHRTYCNGTTGYHEHWNLPPDQLSKELDIKAGESCCTYNLIKLSNDLFCVNPQAKYADYVERALFNDILGSIDPQTGNFMYFHTQKPGGFKTFGRNDQVFWCCTGSGMENHQRYGESFYFHSDNELYVNQFVSSAVYWPEYKVKVEQATSFPDTNTSELTITQGSGDFDLLIRHPSWCAEGFSTSINGQSLVFTTEKNGYVRIHRTWKTGDRIQVNLPMNLRLENLKDAPKTAAIMYGPIVLAGDLGKEGVTDSLRYTTDYFYEKVPPAYQFNSQVPALIGKPQLLKTWMHRVPGIELTFETNATSTHRSIKFYPLYRIFNHRFADYWMFK